MRKRICSMIALILLVSLATFYVTSPQATAETKADPKAGLEIHKKKCQGCHGEQGKGDGPAAGMLEVKLGNWTNEEEMSKVTDDDLLKIITKGGPSVGKSKLMPAFGERLSKQEIQNIVSYVRSLAK